MGIAGEGRIGPHGIALGQFGVATSGIQGLATGILVRAEVQDLFRVIIKGNAGYDAAGDLEAASGGFKGQGELQIAGQQVLCVAAEVSSKRIAFKGVVATLPGLDILSLTSKLQVELSAKTMEASSKSTIKLFGLRAQGNLKLNYSGLLAQGAISTDRVIISVKLVTQRLSAESNGEIAVTGKIKLTRNSRTNLENRAKSKFARELDGTIRWLERKQADDTLIKRPTWDPCIAAAKALRASLTTTRPKLSDLDFVLRQLPDKVAWGVRQIRQSAGLFQAVNVTYSTDLTTAMQGAARLFVSVRYAGNVYEFEQDVEMNPETISDYVASRIYQMTLG